MNTKWLSLINLFLAGLTVALLIFSGGLYLSKNRFIEVDESQPSNKILPQNSFARSDKEYEQIGPPFLKAKFSPISLQLPDLKKHLIYYGRNERPDADVEDALLYFELTGNQDTPHSIGLNEKLYLIYDPSSPRGGYRFSPDNEETSLWFQAKPKGKEAVVTIGMMNDKAEPVTEPKEHAKFSLPQRELVRSRATPWMMGNVRVDGTLLARQKARWWGEDLFMKHHGGEEYADFVGKQRIDFGEKEDKYSIYLGLGDTAIWEGERWRVVKPGPETKEHPLLAVKKIEERILQLELWDIGGAAKVPINMIKSSQAWITQNLEQQFKFVGARTRSQFVFEIKGERILLQPNDWLLYTNNEWKKLSAINEIDDYVNLVSSGVLFIFEGIAKKDGQPALVGTMFNPGRTAMKLVELPVQQAAAPFTSQEKSEIQKINNEDEDEEEDDSDE